MIEGWFPGVVAVSTLIDAGAAALLLWRPWKSTARDGTPPIDLGRILVVALATAGLFLLKLSVLLAFGVRRFGAIHLIYADAIVVIPAAGLFLLIGSSRYLMGLRQLRVTRPALASAIATLAMLPLGWYATWVEPFRLQEEHATIPVPRSRVGKDSIRIAVMADLQTRRVTDYERKAVARLMALKPDLIVLPGDLFQVSPAEFEANLPEFRRLLKQLSAPAGVYFVQGDVDGGSHRIESLLRSTGIIFLANEMVRVTVGDRQVTIGGVELEVTSPRAFETIERLENEPGEEDVRILVAHRPDVVFGLRPRSRIDLVIAGHTHGGQIVLPGFGPPMTLSHVPRNVAAGGWHKLSGNSIYVSRGVGCERGQAPRIRFLCPPEISRLELGASARE